MTDSQRTVNRQSEKQIEDREVRGCWGGWEHGLSPPSVRGGGQVVPTAADIKLRKDWTTAAAGVPLDRRAVYNLDKRMQPIKLRRLVVR